MSGSINQDRRQFLTTAAMTLAATQFGIVSQTVAETARTVRLSNEGNFPSLDGATGWLNSQPLTSAVLRGKVVLVNFWTYTCVNWRRTLPYLRAWSQKYKDHGLVVIGVHTPEFSFEHNVDNIRWALKDMRIEYPVAVDSSYAIWRAFDNQFWPASYFIDAKGHIRHHQFGEGEYLQGEAVIQQLLTEAGFAGFNREPAPVSPYGPEVGADLGNLRSSETYVGYEQTKNFASSHGAAWNKARTYSFPARLDLNSWAVAGNWTAGKEAVALNQSGGRIAYQFHARDLNLVMGPTVQGKPVRFRLTNRSDCVRVAMVATTFHAGRSRYSAAVVSIVVIRILLVGCALRLAPPRRVSGHRSEKATFHPSGKYPLKISEHWRVFQYRFWFSGANRGQCVRWSEIVG